MQGPKAKKKSFFHEGIKKKKKEQNRKEKRKKERKICAPSTLDVAPVLSKEPRPRAGKSFFFWVELLSGFDFGVVMFLFFH